MLQTNIQPFQTPMYFTRESKKNPWGKKKKTRWFKHCLLGSGRTSKFRVGRKSSGSRRGSMYSQARQGGKKGREDGFLLRGAQIQSRKVLLKKRRCLPRHGAPWSFSCRFWPRTRSKRSRWRCTCAGPAGRGCGTLDSGSTEPWHWNQEDEQFKLQFVSLLSHKALQKYCFF